LLHSILDGVFASQQTSKTIRAIKVISTQKQMRAIAAPRLSVENVSSQVLQRKRFGFPPSQTENRTPNQPKSQIRKKGDFRIIVTGSPAVLPHFGQVGG